MKVADFPGTGGEINRAIVEKFAAGGIQYPAPPVELRNNLSLFRSRVAEVPGPDNRLDEQPRATANIGADYRFRGTPLTLGGSLNLTPDRKSVV